MPTTPRRRRTPALLLPLALLGLGGCQAGRTYVLDAPTGSIAAGLADRTPSDAPAAVVLRHQPGSIELTDEQAELFRTGVARHLAKDPRITVMTARPDASTPPEAATAARVYAVDYRFVGLDPGNAPVRIGAALVGLLGVPTGSLGQGSLAVDAVITQRAAPSQTPVGDPPSQVRFLCDGPIDGPGGSVKGGLKTAAESVAKFIDSLLPPPVPHGPKHAVDSGYDQN